MSNNILIMTVGLPRCGKSTWAKEQGLPIVNPDSIRLALHGQPFIKQAEPFVWAIAKTMVRALFLAGHDKVILDATSINDKFRDEWKSRSWERRYWNIRTDKDECIRRARANDQEYLVEIIEKMAGEIDYPTENHYLPPGWISLANTCSECGKDLLSGGSLSFIAGPEGTKSYCTDCYKTMHGS